MVADLVVPAVLSEGTLGHPPHTHLGLGLDGLEVRRDGQLVLAEVGGQVADLARCKMTDDNRFVLPDQDHSPRPPGISSSTW